MGKKTLENMRQTRSQRQNNGRKPPLPAQSLYNFYFIKHTNDNEDLAKRFTWFIRL